MKAGCFVGMNKSTVYFSLAFIHAVRMFVVALSLHLSRGRLTVFWWDKERFFLKNEAQNFTFWTTSPIWLGDGSGESSYPYNHVKKNVKTAWCSNQELQWFKKKVQMVSKVARYRFVSREKCHICCNHLADLARRWLRRKLLSIQPRKKNDKNCIMFQSRVTLV